MRVGISTAGALVSLLLASSAWAGQKTGSAQAQAQKYDRLEAALVAETNALRADPAAYTQHLQARLKRYDGNELTTEDGKLMMSREGASAVYEAIGVLKRTQPLEPLSRKRGLDQAAGELVRDQRGGRIGHTSSDGSGPSDRMTKHYEWDLIAVENIHYGGGSARRIILDLLIDDGVGNRGHRDTLLDPRVEVTGVACGPHARFKTVCVMEYSVPVRDLELVGR